MAIKIYAIFLILFLCSNAFCARSITLPHSEDFTESTSIDDITYISAGMGSSVTRTQESWRGASNYCLRIDPPTCQSPDCVAGINGGYAAIGSFDFTATNIVNIAFALNVGTTYSSSASDEGGGLINKFIDLFNGAERTGLLGLNDRNTVNSHEFGLAEYPGAFYNYYGVPPAPTNDLLGIHFDDGISTDDFGGQWIFINYVVNHSTGVALLRVWDRNGNYSSDYFSISEATVNSTSQVRTIGGYYNESHPTADTNSRLLIDDLTISNSADEIEPPDGFISGSETAIVNGGVTFSGCALH